MENENNPLLIQLGQLDFDDSIFNPMKSGTGLDLLISDAGGIMPATIAVCCGSPGLGKSIVTLDWIANIQSQNPALSVLFVSAEMKQTDMFSYTRHFPHFRNVTTFFPGDFIEDAVGDKVISVFEQGWNLILVDSLAAMLDILRGENSQLNQNTAEKWFINLMLNHTQGLNSRKIYTAFILIQQVTKSGIFAGSMKLKHETTAMMEMRRDEEGNRYIEFSKNRRGTTLKRMYFNIITGKVEYDINRWHKDAELKEKINTDKEKERLQIDEDKFNELFGFMKNEIVELETTPIEVSQTENQPIIDENSTTQTFI